MKAIYFQGALIVIFAIIVLATRKTCQCTTWVKWDEITINQHGSIEDAHTDSLCTVSGENNRLTFKHFTDGRK